MPPAYKLVIPRPRYLPTRRVCERLGLTEDALRRALRRCGAPRPPLHPTARVFLWTEADVQAMAEFLGRCVAPDQRNGTPREGRQP